MTRDERDTGQETVCPFCGAPVRVRTTRQKERPFIFCSTCRTQVVTHSLYGAEKLAAALRPREVEDPTDPLDPLASLLVESGDASEEDAPDEEEDLPPWGWRG